MTFLLFTETARAFIRGLPSSVDRRRLLKQSYQIAVARGGGQIKLQDVEEALKEVSNPS